MSAPRHETRSDQEGFIIIEVLVSAIILALVAGAVLTLITATTHSEATARTRAVAYDIAQEQLSEMRTMRITTLNGYREEETPVVDGTKYKVTSTGVFVNNNASGVSCSSANSSADYIELTSTVESPQMISPISLQSVVSPETGSLDPTHGTLSVQTTNLANEPVSGVSVSLTPSARSATTETQGCAIFADLPAATYKVKFVGNGLVTPEGQTELTKENVSVTAGRSPERVSTTWDRAATFEPQFVYLEPGTGTERPAPVDTMWVYNAISGQPATVVGTPAGARSSTLLDSTAYPFKKSTYTVFAGSCSSNNPDPEGKTPANDVGLYSVEAVPGGVYKPKIRVPALELTVESAGGGKVSGAKVTLTDTKCKTGSTLLKRTFSTNVGGHLAKAAGETATEAGLPFGTYNICASAKIGSETQSATLAEVKVENLTSTGTVKTLKLAKGGSECP